MLSGTVLPAHPHPYHDEIFSSWLARVARANGQKLHTFCRMILGEISIWNRDIDKSVTTETLQRLAEKTGLSLEQTQRTSLASFEGTLYTKHNHYGVTPCILPLGVYHRVRRRYGLQFCPRCLAGPKPYFRKIWRIALYTACPEHVCMLLDKCPACNAAVMFHRRDFLSRASPDNSSLAACHACGFNLAAAPVVSAEKNVVQFLCSANQALLSGWIELPKYGPVYSFLYFAVVRHLMKLVTIDRKCSVMFARAGISEGPIINTAGRGIEYLDISARHHALRSVILLLDNWPVAFIDHCQRAGLRMSALLKDFEDAPWWYASVVRRSLMQDGYQTSKEEIASAISWMRNSGIHISGTRINQLLGKRDSKLVQKFLSEHRQISAKTCYSA